MHDACRYYILQKVLLVGAFFTVRHEKFAIVVKCKWGKINFEIKPPCHKITIKTVYLTKMDFSQHNFFLGPKFLGEPTELDWS